MAAQDVMRLEGIHLGRSQEPGKWRLYLTSGFARYLEFPKAQTLRSERLEGGRVVAWVRRGAPITEATAAAASGPADFLEGGLLDHLKRADDADTIRRLFGLSLVKCGEDKPPPNKSGDSTGLGGTSCPDPNTCTTPGCCKTF